MHHMSVSTDLNTPICLGILKVCHKVRGVGGNHDREAIMIVGLFGLCGLVYHWPRTHPEITHLLPLLSKWHQ